MNRITKNSSGYVGYDYKTITVFRNKAKMYIDGYQNFGWELDDEPRDSKRMGNVSLTFRRDRKIIHKTELTRLDRHFEACMEEVDTLENSKGAIATAVSIAIGVIGTGLMTGSVFAYLADPPKMVLSIFLGILALAGWIAPTFVYSKLLIRRTERIDHLIEQKYDEIHAIREKGFNLLNR